MEKLEGPNMFSEERRRHILEIIEKDDRVNTKYLCEKFNTTPVTIRKDLAILEEKGELLRTHGGAIQGKKLYQGLALSEKEKMFLEEKNRIVKNAVNLILPGDTIILDSGSTISLLAKEIRNLSGITIITNAVNIAYDLSKSNNVIILTGGHLKKDSMTLTGPLADVVLNRISAGKLFFGVDGIDFGVGLTTPDIMEANTTRCMMAIAGEKILLVDSSKIGRRSLAVISKIDEIDQIITTKKFTEKEIKKFTNLGVKVKIV
jgi:DeoR family transcriptional regulator of aga operon